MVSLTEGICEKLQSIEANKPSDLLNGSHVVQVISVKPVTSQSGTNPPRYRVILSDGVHFIQAMLATQLNDFIDPEDESKGSLKKNTIIEIQRLGCNVVQNKKLLILIGLGILEQANEKIGNPVSLSSKDAGASPAQGTASTSAAAITSAPVAVAAPPPRQGSSRGSNSSLYLIEGLSPYQNNWKIKARVVQKSDIKTYSNARGEGKLFNVTLMDDSGEIRGTAFNAVCDKLYDKLQEGKVFYISKARVNLAKKKWSNVNNDYELDLNNNTEVEECLETSGLPQIKYNFVTFDKLQERQKDSTCDVIGVVHEATDLQHLQSKAGKDLIKRELTLVDRSGCSVRMTLWSKEAESYSPVEPHPVVAFRGVKVSDFGGRSLGMGFNSLMFINPETEECFTLKGWYDTEGHKLQFKAQSGPGGSMSGVGPINRNEFKTLFDVKESGLGMNDQGAFFATRATIMHIKDNPLVYPGCRSETCNKKVVEINDSWRCEKCDKSFDKPEYRYLLYMAVADCSAQAWLSGFNDAGNIVFGMTADQLVEIRDRDPSLFSSMMQKALGQTLNFTCRAKQDTYNEQTRVRYGITRIVPLNYKEECRLLRDALLA
ncbi:replication factor-a protein [Fistulina hepatica ATCC 64428]|nr:replication factor-a protein [Fistulina hepatica ATCC 64428]